MWVTSSKELIIELPSNSLNSVTVPSSMLPHTYGLIQCQRECPLVAVELGGVTSYEPTADFVELFQSNFPSYVSSVRSLN